MDWNRLDVRYGEHPNCDVKMPPQFEAMMDIAKQLSKGLPFLHVDFFDVDDRLYLSEQTLDPSEGQTLLYRLESFNRERG